MDNAAFHQEFIKLLCRRRHILKSLTKRNNGKSHPFQVLRHLHRTPAVKGDLQDMIPLTQILNKFLNEAVMDHVSLCRHQIALLVPDVIGDGCPAHTKGNRFLRDPEIGEKDILLILRPWREHQHKGGNVPGTGKIQPSVALPAFERLYINGSIPKVVDMLRNEPGQARHPHIETELFKHIFFRRVLQCVPVHIPDTLNLDGLTERRVCFIPVLFIMPVIIVLQTVDDRIEGVVNLPSLQDIQCFHMELIADTFPVRPRCGNQEIQRLLTGIAGSFGKDIIELPVWLRMNLVQHKTGDVQAMFRPYLRRQHLVETCVCVIHNPLGSAHDLTSLQQGRGHLHHLVGYIENDGCLLAVGGSTVNLRRRLIVRIQKVKCHGSGKLTLSIFLSYFYKYSSELPVSALIHDAKHIPHNLFLPRKQPETLSCPLPLGVPEVLNKCHRPFCLCLIIV